MEEILFAVLRTGMVLIFKFKYWFYSWWWSNFKTQMVDLAG